MRRCLPAIPTWRSAFPPIRYLARIETPDGVLAGATAPGVPFLVLGHNGHIAWSFTTTGADVQDVFIETPVGDSQYQTPDGPHPFSAREERIKICGGPDQFLTVRETRHGPVISDLPGSSGGPLLAVSMANLAPGNTAAAGLLALNQARDVDAAGKAAAVITAPVQNLLVADRERIAMYVTGRVPIRRAGDGSAPVSGDGSHDWTGWASGEQLPHIIAPTSGRLVNANDRIAPRISLSSSAATGSATGAPPVSASCSSDRIDNGGRLRPHAGRRAFAPLPARS